ncbi:TRAP transporter small permease subunit [Cognatishimia activa]|uniref:TRAP transporter small permease protein n=1 Tax=Cognatishimia activa TaxID=1715691 RepID=A0A0P1IP43_9RHOB|nr:TRAP transporter small permease subunit [Cognatishimia activa]CUJ28450.1 TRAP-type mannitol/chloroaromatic compound transport system, small permease component [Cognatishimia activa]CUK25254.1 TRAP-type mannitol/chloroaromatic compound transport system, small permease component [Cognatishimia activa]
MLDAIVWLFANIGAAFVNFGSALVQPSLWLSWMGGLTTVETKQALMRFVYYGGSIEFFFVVFTAFLLLTAVGIWRRSVMWGAVIALETIANTVGRLFAWAGLLMVLQQIVIVFMQRIFTSAQISFGFGSAFTRDVSWWAEELKFYNALIVTLCATYTFVQGGHVRVDLVYSVVKYRTKKIIDMVGSLIFMMPAAVLMWMYGWYFMWRHLVTPKVSASDNIDLLMRKSRILKWNVETIGFSPNGFDAYFLFKMLLVAFAGLIFLHSIAFFYRSYLEYVEGPESEGKHLDRDSLGEGEEAYEGTH